MSSKRGFPARTALAAAVGVVALISVAAPAMADDDGWKKHHGHYKPYIVAPGYVYGGYYYAPSPPVVYYAPPAPVYVEPPPPMVYAPPPVYYAPPSGLSLGINVPLR